MDSVKAGPDRSFAPSPWLVLAVLASGAGASWYGARELPAWRAQQDLYLAKDPAFQPGLRAAPLGPVSNPPADAQEYCSTCHLVGAGYAAMDDAPFAAHPEVGHDPLELGCVPCHKGDPGSLALHDTPAFGRDRPLTGAQAWTSCLHCHDAVAQAELLAPWPAVGERQALLTRLFGDHGCLACHDAGGRGGLVGPSLASFGATLVSDPTAAYRCRLEQAAMQLEDPAALQPATRMPTPALEPHEREALAVWLSLQGHMAGMNRGAWVPGQPGALSCADETWGWFCQPCHGEAGAGRERGRPPGAVPALASEMWLAYAPPALIRSTVEQGREGSLMEGFRPAEGAPILTSEELDGLIDHILDAGLVQRPDPTTRLRVAAASCAQCHPQRRDYLEGRDDVRRAAYLEEHPWRWSLEDWLEDEGLVLEGCLVDAEDADGEPIRVHSGEILYEGLCVHCHDDPERSPAGMEPSAPALRGWFDREHFDAGTLLASVILGRPDAPPGKWRHQGITAGEYAPADLACLARWLEANP